MPSKKPSGTKGDRPASPQTRKGQIGKGRRGMKPRPTRRHGANAQRGAS